MFVKSTQQQKKKKLMIYHRRIQHIDYDFIIEDCTIFFSSSFHVYLHFVFHPMIQMNMIIQ